MANFKKNLDAIHERLSRALQTKARDLDWRKKQLRALKSLLVDNEQAIADALWKDFRKSNFETAVTETGIVISEIDYVLSHLGSWVKAKRVSTPLLNQLGSSQIRKSLTASRSSSAPGITPCNCF